MNGKMNAYRLTWNPSRPEYRRDIEYDGPVTRPWRCGKARIRAGTRIYLVRLGEEPRGLIGAGRALGKPSTDDDPRVLIDFEILGPKPRPGLKLNVLKTKPPYNTVAWENQRQAIIVPPEVCEEIDRKLGITEGRNEWGYTSADEVREAGFPEGARKQVWVNTYERDPKARRACIKHHGVRCKVCQLDFEERYGQIGAGFIHVHHLRPLSEIGENYRVKPAKDLAPVCPNCHAMLHKRTPPYSILELKKMLRSTENG